jgi:uncharacterized protein VirK/YbjX
VVDVHFDRLTLWRRSAVVFADDSFFNGIKHRVEFTLGVNSEKLRMVENELNEPHGVTLRQAMVEDHRLYGFFYWPFLHKDFNVAKRFHFLAQHKHIVQTLLSWMALSGKDQFELLDLSAHYPQLKLIIESAPWFFREGCLNFSLMLGDRRLMTLAFTLVQTEEKIDCYVGSMQGSSESDATEIYKAIAETLEDVRPRDFVFKTFRLFMLSLGINEIHCIADDCHIRNHAFFGGGRSSVIQLPYDAMWVEHGAVNRGEGFFRIASGISERPIAEVPQKKRGRYKRRLEMLQNIGTGIDSLVKKMTSKEIN